MFLKNSAGLFCNALLTIKSACLDIGWFMSCFFKCLNTPIYFALFRFFNDGNLPNKPSTNETKLK